MPISVSCRCGKEYQLSDTLAGKKGRCKACGEVFAIPLIAAPVTKPKPVPKKAEQSQAVDLFAGLDDGPAVERPRTSTRASAAMFGVNEPEENDDDDELPAPRRRSSSAPKRKRRVIDEEAKSKYRGSGFSMLIFGGMIFILPMVGLQWRIVNFLPPIVQAAIGLLLIVMGIGSLVISSLDAPPSWLGPVALLGVVGFLVFGAAIVLPAMNRVNQPQPFNIAQPQRPNFVPPRPPQFNPPPNLPAQPAFPNPVNNPNVAANENRVEFVDPTQGLNNTPDIPNNGPMQSMIPPGGNMPNQPGMMPPRVTPRPVLPRTPRPTFPRRGVPGGQPPM